MRLKRVLAACLVTSMIFGLTACGKSGTSDKADSSTTKGDNKSYDKIVYSYATFNNIPEASVLDTVEEAINEITREKIGVEVELLPIAIADYTSNVALGLQGGDQIDCFQTLGNFNVAVSSNMAYDLTSLMDTCAPETKELLGENFLAACKKDGKQYAIPTYKPYALTPMIIYRQDIADELSIDMNTVKSIYDLTPVLEQVKEAYPNMTPLIPCQTGDSGMGRTIAQVDYLTDDLFSPKGVLIGDDMNVTDLYSTEEFSKLCDLTRSWYNDGLIMKDAATTTSTATELMSSGNSFCYIASYSYPTEDTAASLEGQCGNVDLGAVQIGDAYLATDSICAVSWMVSSTSKKPEAALKFLNLTFTDKDIINLLIYGIEGRDYVKVDNDYVAYPEGQSAATVPYTAQLSCGTLGNFFLMYPMVGTNLESLAWEEEQNVKAKTSPAMGFLFDSSSVKTEYTAVSNVINQYLPGLSCGSVDPATALPEFINKLNAAGYDKILAAKQTQLDEWIKNNK
ncbi:MAG: ABC transporter substrate-binding protein [Clostridiales bacterium]|nr:ABC transporter substrate-binding protein [Clostridiales bacterium]